MTSSAQNSVRASQSGLHAAIGIAVATQWGVVALPGFPSVNISGYIVPGALLMLVGLHALAWPYARPLLLCGIYWQLVPLAVVVVAGVVEFAWSVTLVTVLVGLQCYLAHRLTPAIEAKPEIQALL